MRVSSHMHVFIPISLPLMEQNQSRILDALFLACIDEAAINCSDDAFVALRHVLPAVAQIPHGLQIPVEQQTDMNQMILDSLLDIMKVSGIVVDEVDLWKSDQQQGIRANAMHAAHAVVYRVANTNTAKTGLRFHAGLQRKILHRFNHCSLENEYPFENYILPDTKVCRNVMSLLETWSYFGSVFLTLRSLFFFLELLSPFSLHS